MRHSAENITQGDQTDELAAGGSEDGELIEALLAHDLDSSLAGEVGGNCGDGLQTQGANLRASQGVFGSRLLSLLGLGEGRGQKIVGSEPIIIGKLDNPLVKNGKYEWSSIDIHLTLVR
jgi:hypothetical protein